MEFILICKGFGTAIGSVQQETFVQLPEAQPTLTDLNNFPG
jgi:hypothetical protein